MTKAELLKELREVIGDTVPQNYNWSSPRLIGLLSEGQDKFCEQTGFFIDSTSFTVTTVAGQYHYDIPARVIQVLEVFISGRRLQMFNDWDRPMSQPLGVENTTPTHWQTDNTHGKLTFYEPPVAGLTAQLRVWRHPTAILTQSAGEPEIPIEFRRGMVSYAAAKVFADKDSELFDPKAQRLHEGDFARYCSDGRTAFRRITNRQPKIEVSPIYSFR